MLSEKSIEDGRIEKFLGSEKMCWWVFGHCWQKIGESISEKLHGEFGKTLEYQGDIMECCKCGKKEIRNNLAYLGY